MRLFNSLAYEGVLNDTQTAYSSTQLDRILGRAEKLVVQVVVSAEGTDPTLTVVEETSEDGMHWNDKATLVGPTSLSTASMNVFYCFDSSTSVHGSLVRFRLDAGGTNTTLKLALHVCGRAQ